MPTTAPQIHAHELIDLIRLSQPALTPAELAEAARRQFGADARFHTCSAAGMTVPQVVEFLLQRRKVELQDGRLIVQEANVCQH